MSDHLLPYYNRELLYLRQMAKEFAARHPKIAGNLRMSGDGIDDPHVARLAEGVAFLNARINHKLDDEFPELVNTLLDILYPHYLAPIPSMATVQFKPKAEVTTPQTIPVNTELDSEPVEGETCRFRTRYPVTLWPITVADASLKGRPLVAPSNARTAGAFSCLKLTLRCTAPDTTFSSLQPESLRFFLRGQPSHVYALHELLFNNTMAIAIADNAADPNPVFVKPEAVSPVGFGPEEVILPYAPQSQPAYRTLTEFFIFPDKFLYFDVDLSTKVLGAAGTELSVFFYFNRSDPALERAITKDFFALGCTPIVNLFRQRSEPVLVGQNRLEYRVIPDARRPEALEVHSLTSVIATDAEGKRKSISPFYARRPSQAQDHAGYWATARRRSEGRLSGTEVFLSFSEIDPAFASTDIVVAAETLCLNRDLPAKLPYGGGHPVLTPVQVAAAIGEVSCISPLTHTIRIPDGDARNWRLISHLMLNHLSLVGEGGLEALQETLMLYDFRGSPETRLMIEGITALSARRGTARAPKRPGDVAWGDAICQGIDLVAEFNPANFSGSSLFLFAMVLDQFFGLHASINSFTRLTATVKGQPGSLRTWPARAGYRPLL
ncbi:type VI secretion system protein ImpG [Azorhizobium oxalatiphilum]|uniref:Type VI secretion system protein ImpG n=1 Tax=Azorhizobium oxalatiphilum TaxID=980631 RepID=A0A917BUW5_9HYPH|nr:type VI secretion system baseplate subunit TssF [Azorhizobium oxalatiphilum]GGF57711.1 type VI secretion system protein ImpG [Azorhizobium oxalatiphilum]